MMDIQSISKKRKCKIGVKVKYEDVEFAISLKNAIQALECLKHDLNTIISETEFLDNRDFDSVFRKITILLNNREKALEDL